MSIRPGSDFQNILLTLKKYKNDTFEILYLSGNAVKFLKDTEKFHHQSFFERLLPTIRKPFFESIFKLLGKGDTVEVPFVTSDWMFQWIRIEGHTIAQEDGSYLVNAMFSLKDVKNHIDQAWLISDNTIYFCSDNVNQEKIQNKEEVAKLIQSKYQFLDIHTVNRAILQKENCQMDIFKDYLILKNTKIDENFNLIGIHYLQEEKGIAKVIKEEEDKIYKNQPGTIFYEHQLKNKTVNWSGATYHILGYALDEFKKLDIFDWMELIHPDDRFYIKTGFEEDFSMENSLEITYRVRHMNGSYVYVQDTAKPFFDTKTGKKVVFGTIRDISHLKKIEKDLIDNQFKLQELTGVVPGMVFMQKTMPDLNHHFLFVSDGCEQLFELSREKIMGDSISILRLIHRGDIAYLREKVAKSYYTDTRFEVYFRITTSSGKQKWIYGTADRLKNYREESVWAGVFIDVTQAKLKEEEANQNFLKYRSIFDESPMSILQYDKALTITEVNKTLLKKLRFKDKGQIIGKNVRSLSTDENVVRVFQEAVEAGKGKFEGPYILTVDESKSYSKISTVEIGYGISYQAFIEDISEKEFVQNLLNQVAELTDLYPDKNFFDEIVKLLTKCLQINYCYIGEFNKNKETIDILSIAKDGELIDSFSYNVRGSISEETFLDDSLSVNIFNKGVMESYPEDNTLRELKIQSYVGIKIQGYQEDNIGLLVLMNNSPLENVQGYNDLFRILRDRIGAELRRLMYEKELIDTNKMQKTIINGTEYAVFSIDHHFEINLINDNTLSIFNIKDKSNLLSTDLIHNGKSISLKEIIKNSDATPNFSNYYLLPLENGESRELKISISSVSYGESKDLNYVVFVDDITERTASEKRLVESEQLYLSIAENFPRGTVDVLDTDFKYIYTEGKEYKEEGINPKILIGTSYLNQYDGEALEIVRNQVGKVLAGEMISYELLYGNQSYLQSGVPLINNKGEIERILLVKQNISDLKKFEIEREKLIKDLKSHNEELLRFAYIVSHNLRAPIVNISLLIDLYDKEDPGSLENQEVIENLKVSSTLLNATLQDLIEVVSIKKQKIPKVEVIDFRMLLNNVEKSLFKQLKESDTEIEKDFSGLQEISYIYAHLENFFLNFMTNAVKYKHPDRKPRVKIKTFTRDDYCIISFSDNGIGLDIERYKDRLFGLYQRFHNHVEGKGLGLYLVREQIRAHDGNIEIDSEVGKGTTITVYLRNMNHSQQEETEK